MPVKRPYGTLNIHIVPIFIRIVGLGLGRRLCFPPLGLKFSSEFSFSDIPGTVKSAPIFETIS